MTLSPSPSSRTETRQTTVVVDTRHSPFCRLRPLDLSAVALTDTFWEPRRQINRLRTLPSQYQQCADTGRFDNFRRAAGLTHGEFQGRFFNDSDVYKWIEAAAWTLATTRDAALQAQVDEVIALIAAAQDANGYLNTYFTFAGHLIQAAIAHHRALDSHTLLDVAVRFADHIDDVFGVGKRAGAPGHPEIEMALVELARETGEQRYLALAQFFVAQRGQQPPVSGGKDYCQDHEPFRDQREVVGHAVRALYLYSGTTDLYAETGDDALWQTVDALWHNLSERKLYITGGVGARYEGESMGDAYELPNERAYAETCAAIANVMWAWRLLLVTGEARFADALEIALYNGVLSGLSLDGETYFYENPLADRGGHRRQPWFGTACCPPNIARLLASLPGYVYTTSDEGLWVHLYATGTATATLDGIGPVTLRQQTDYPWDGEITLTVESPRTTLFSLFLRVPAWAEGADVTVNGEAVGGPVQSGRYKEIRRQWTKGDVVRLTLPLPVRVLSSHPHVTSNRDRVAVLRGPLVYCVEGTDHPGVDPWDLILPAHAAWSVVREPDLLGGVTVLQTDALTHGDDGWDGQLYRPFDAHPPAARRVPLTAIPYYAWANREAGPMQVWLPVTSDLQD